MRIAWLGHAETHFSHRAPLKRTLEQRPKCTVGFNDCEWRNLMLLHGPIREIDGEPLLTNNSLRSPLLTNNSLRLMTCQEHVAIQKVLNSFRRGRL